MVAIVTGAGLGLDRSSLNSLGAQGQLGGATVGDQGVDVTVNAANGNLLIQRADEILTGVGQDDIVVDAYNSLSASTGYGASNGWQTNNSRSVWGLTGTVDTAGSTVYRTDADGSVETYSWNTTTNSYVCEQNGNADDQITFSSTNNTWTWTDLSSGTTEVYDVSNSGRLISSTDASGNTLTYSYNANNQLAQITTADGEYTQFTYSGNDLTSITNYTFVGGVLTAGTQITYTYDSSDRLSTVTTPTSGGNSVVTTYGYSGATNLVTSISQTGGAQLTIAYNASNQVSNVTQTLSSGVTTTTSFSYGSNSTTVTDNNGNATVLTYDANGNLIHLTSPTGQVTAYTYNSNGDVLTATDPEGNVTIYTYDANNNLLTQTDPLGNSTTYTYNAQNQVLTATTTSTTSPYSLSAGNETIVVANPGDTVTFNPIFNDTYTTGDTVTITGVSAAAHGLVSIVNGGTAIQYTRTSAGANSFTYTVMDAQGHVATATVTVADSTTASSQPPVAGNMDLQFGLAATGVSWTFNPLAYCSDPNGYALTITAVSTPTMGTATIASGGQSITYAPTNAFGYDLYGDSFTYTISDGHGHTATATISVGAGNQTTQSPTATNFTVFTPATPITFDPLADATSENGSPLTITYVSTPTYGTVSVGSNGTTITYTPGTSFGAAGDSFTYYISNGQGYFASGTITVVDASGNAQTIVANNNTITSPGAGNSVIFNPLNNDANFFAYPMTITSASAAAHGTVSIVNSGTEISYAATGPGADSFTYTVSDGHGNSTTATVLVDPPVVQPPMANNVTVYSANAAVTFDPVATGIDVNGYPMTITSISSPLRGTATIGSGGTTITYTPTNLSGIGYFAFDVAGDSFTYTLSDGHGDTATATVSVNYGTTNTQLITANDDTETAPGVGNTLTFKPMVNDANFLNYTMTITAVSSATHGVATIVNGGTAIAYAQTSSGPDSFTYTISDGHGHTATATVNITGPAFAFTATPTVSNLTVETPNSSTSITFDPLVDVSTIGLCYPLSIVAVTVPADGTATINSTGTAITYTPNSSFGSSGDSFGYTVSDGHGYFASATVTVAKGSTNTQVLAANYSTGGIQYIANPGVGNSLTFNPLVNDANLLNYGMTITAVSSPSHGTATITSAGIIYTPSASGTDSFTYTFSDGHGNTKTATVSVGAASSANVVATDVSVQATNGSSVTFNPIGDNTDVYGYPMKITSVSTPQWGTATISSSGTSITYTPTSLTYLGLGYYVFDIAGDTFSYTMSDGYGHSATAIVTVTEGGTVTQMVSANNDTITSAGVGSTITFNPLTTDSNTDNYAMTITSVSSPTRGTATIVNSGTAIAYAQTSAGPDEFTYTISDGHGHTATATVVVADTAQTTNTSVNSTQGGILLTTSYGSSVSVEPAALVYNTADLPLTVTSVSSPAYGTVTISNNGATITYKPTSSTFSTAGDSFTYTLSDVWGASYTNTITVDPTSIFGPLPQTIAVNSDTVTAPGVGNSVTFNPLTYDANLLAYPMTITAVSAPGRGTATIVSGGTGITYMQTTAGSDSFTYTLSDGHGHTQTATVSIVPADAPLTQKLTANDNAIVANAVGDSTTFNPLLNDANLLGYGMTITSVSSASHGTVAIIGGTQIKYTRTSAGSDTFTYTISDGHGTTATATITVSGSVSGGTTAPVAAPLVTSRYVYDAYGNLCFTITGDGEVTQYVYNATGQQTSVITYVGDAYSISGLTSSQSPSLSTMQDWAAGLTDLANTQRVDTTYDLRGNVSTVTTYSACSSTGAGLTTSPYTVETYVYSPSGELLSKQTSGQANDEVYTYDGLGRVLTATNLNGGTTTYQYNDSSNTVTATSPLGLTTISVYNLAGELLSTTQSGASIATGTVSYAYDDLGNLCMVTDADGNKTYFLYDTDGRKVADIAADGSINHTIYTLDDQIAATVSYANKLSSAQLSSLVNASGQPADPALSSVLPTSSSNDSWNWNIYDASNRKIESINGDGDVTLFEYDDNSNLIWTSSFANALSPTALAGFKTTPPTTLQLPTPSVGKDGITRNFYNNEGQLIATLDGNGYLTQNAYDEAGQLIKTVASANRASSSLWANGALAQLQTSVGTSSHDIVDYNVYDDQGNLRYTLNTNLQVTEFDYNGTGQVTTTIQYVGSIAAQSSYTVATVQGAVSTAGLASNTSNRKSWNIYDTSTGNLDYTIDAMGDVTQYTYNALGQVTKLVQFAVQNPQTSLPSVGTVASWATSHLSNTANRITRNIYNAGGQLSYTAQIYDAAGDSYVTGYYYDAAGRTTGKAQFAASYTVTDSTTAAALTTTIGYLPPGMAWATYAYNADGQLTDTTNAFGVVTHLTYDALGRVVSSTAAYGLSDASTTQYTYDAAGNVLTETQGYGTSVAATTSYTYDGLGNVLTTKDPDGNTTTYTYDALGNLLTTTDPTGATTANTYDAFNNVLTSTNGLGGKSYFFYDDLDRLTLQIDPIGYATATTYGFGSEIATITHYYTAYTGTITPGTAPTITANSQDATTSFTRDVLGRVTHETDAVGNTQSFAYNAFGNQTSSTNALGGTTTYTYDNRGLMLSETLPETSTNANGAVEATSVTNTYSYDARGNRTQMVEGAGLTEQRTTTYTYDTLNRLTSVSGDAVQAYSASLTATTVTPTTTYTYDDRGDLILTTDPMGAQTFYYYDTIGRKIAEIDTVVVHSSGVMSTWAYDANGNVTAYTVYGGAATLPQVAGGTPAAPPSGGSRQTTYTYDKDDRLLTTTVANVLWGYYGPTLIGVGYWAGTGNLVTSNTYDAMGNLVKQTDPNGYNVYTYYDKAGRKIAQVDQDNYLTTYTLDANGNVLTQTQYATALSAAPSVGTVPTSPASNANDRITTFTYDKNGNRLTETRANVVAYSENGFTGVLTAATGSSTITYTYNGLGEVTRETQATGDYIAYTYDSEGRQTQIQLSGFGLGTTIQPTTKEYYDGLNDLTRTSQLDANNAATAARVTMYTYGAGGRLATMTDADGFERSYSYDADGRTMAVSYTRLLPDGITPVECDNYQYDALGRVIAHGTASFNFSTWTWNFNDQFETAYDAYGDVVSQSVNGIVQTTNVYDNAGRLTSTSTDGVKTLYAYDANGNQSLAVTTNTLAMPSGYSWSTLTLAQAVNLLNSNGTTLLSTNNSNALGLTVTFTSYDGRGQALQTIEPWRQFNTSTTATISQSNVYDAFGDVIASTDADGYTTHYTYSTLGSLTQQILPSVNYTSNKGVVSSANPTTTYYYDISGRQIGTRDANGNLTTQWLLENTGYDGSNALVVNTFDPDGGVINNGYDVFGDLIRSTNQIGDVTTYTYDAMGRVTSEQDPVRPGGSVGNPSSSAFGQTTYYAYDGLGQRIETWNIELGTVNTATVNYDAEGRISYETDMAGRTTNYTYSWNGSAVTNGLGTFGGWVVTTVNTAGLTQIQTQNIAGQTIAETDDGGLAHTLTYDAAGRLKSETTGTIGTVNYYYYNGGDLWKEVSNPYTTSFNGFDLVPLSGTPTIFTDSVTEVFNYDAQGNRIGESTTETVSQKVASSGWTETQVITSESASATYDALNRMTSLTEAGGNVAETDSSGGAISYNFSPSSSVTWEYDLNGNVINQDATYQTVADDGTISSGTTTQNYWFNYDSMNRVTTSDGQLDGAAGSQYVDRGMTGTDYTYNAAGERVSSTITGIQFYGSGIATQSQETLYTYTADGYLAEVNLALGALDTTGSTSPPAASGTGYVQATYTLDQMGRVLSQSEFDSSGNTVYSRSATYDNDSNLLTDQVTDVRSDGTYVSDDIYTYNDLTSGHFDGGVVTSETTATYKNGTYQATSLTQNYYFGTQNGLVQNATRYTPDTSKSLAYDTEYAYDGSGRLLSSQINDGTPRTINYVTNIQGEILSSITTASKNAPDSFYDFFGGVQMGVISNNGSQNVSYSASIVQQTTKPGSGLFTDNATTGSQYAAFGTQLEQINGFGNQTQTPPSYTVQAGDTLQSIAQEIWGDSSYWYLLADANGLDGSSTLVSGETLTIPQVVGTSQNNASTNTVYNPAQAQGNTSPTHPPKPQSHHGCGVFGEVVELVVAAVVAVFAPEAIGLLAPELGGGIGGSIAAGAIVGAGADAVEQGVGLATGLQSQFSWAGVAEGAIGGAIGGGLGGVPGNPSSAAFSGLGQVEGAIARGIAGSLLSEGLDVATGLQKSFDWNSVAGASIGAVARAEIGPVPVGGLSLNIGGMAGAIASAAIRSASNGSDFADNLGRYLPQAIGQTIGNAIASSQTPDDGIEQVQVTPERQLAGSPPLSQAELDDIMNTVNNLPVQSGGSVSAADLGGNGWTSIGTTGNTVQTIPVEIATLPPIPGYTAYDSNLDEYSYAELGSANGIPNTPDNRFVISAYNAATGDLAQMGNALAHPVDTIQNLAGVVENGFSNFINHPIDTIVSAANDVVGAGRTFVGGLETAAQNNTLPEFLGATFGHAAIFGLGVATDTEELEGVDAVATTVAKFGDSVEVTGQISAEDANAALAANAGYTKPSYLLGSQVQQITTNEELQFVRVSSSELNNVPGRFIVTPDEIAGMTPEEIQQHLALPYVPDQISDVTVPAGTRIQVGVVNPQPTYGASGLGIQVELVDEIPLANFGTPRPIK